MASIELAFTTAISAADIGDLTVSVWTADSSGNPAAKLTDLTKPMTASETTSYSFPSTIPPTAHRFGISGGFTSFTAPSNTTLSSSTTYLVVLTYDDQKFLWATASDTQTGATDWSIANQGRFKSTSWEAATNGYSLQIRVNGTVKVADTTAPTVAITGVPSTSNAPFTATFTFSEPVTGFVVGDITLGNAAASVFTSTSGSVYTALITPAADGMVTVDVAAGVAEDAAANGNTAAPQATSTYTAPSTMPRYSRTRAR